MRIENEPCPVCGGRRVDLPPGQGRFVVTSDLRVALAADAGDSFSCSTCGHEWRVGEEPAASTLLASAVPEPEIDEDALEARWAARFGTPEPPVEG